MDLERRNFLKLLIGGGINLGLLPVSTLINQLTQAQAERQGDPIRSLVFAHGFGASSSGGFYPRLKAEMERVGVECHFPDLPLFTSRQTAAQPSLKFNFNQAVTTVATALDQAKRPRVLAGHSLGGFITLVVLSDPNSEVVTDHLVTISARYQDPRTITLTEECLQIAYGYTLEPERINSRVSWKKFVIHSVDDEAVPADNAGRLSRDVGGTLVLTEGRKHFLRPEDGAEIIDLIKSL